MAPGFAGIPIASREFYQTNYLLVGKLDPQYQKPDSRLSVVYRDESLSIIGVGFGYIDPRIKRRFGYTDNNFWYKGECRVFRVKDIPLGSVTIATPPGLPDGLPGFIEYQRAPNGLVYLKKSNGKHGLILDYRDLVARVDQWLRGQEPITNTSKWQQCGFFFLGQRYWQLGGGQVLPEYLIDMLRTPEQLISGLLANLPETEPADSSTGASSTSSVTVNWPGTQRQARQPFNISSLLYYSLLSRFSNGRNSKRNRRG